MEERYHIYHHIQIIQYDHHILLNSGKQKYDTAVLYCYSMIDIYIYKSRGSMHLLSGCHTAAESFYCCICCVRSCDHHNIFSGYYDGTIYHTAVWSYRKE